MAKEIALKYGCNPNQKPSRIYVEDGELPVTVLNGKPGYINFFRCIKQLAACKRIKKKQQDFLQQLLSSTFLLQVLQLDFH